MQEPRDKNQEARGKNQEVELFAVRFLCDSAPLRAKRRKKQETRNKRQEPRGLSLVSRILLLLIKLIPPKIGKDYPSIAA